MAGPLTPRTARAIAGSENLLRHHSAGAFQKFDRDRSGYISASELRVALGSLHQSLRIAAPTDGQVSQAFNMYDADHSGGLDQNEFMSCFRHVVSMVGGSNGLSGGQAPKYMYNGQAYDSLDAVRAAMAGGGGVPQQVAAADSAGTLKVINSILEDTDRRNQVIGQIFSQYAGADGHLQQHELTGMAQMMSVKLGIDQSFFENVQQMFFRFDFSGDEQLDLEEAKKLIKFLLKEQKKLLEPAEKGTVLTSLPRKNVEQEFELGKKLGQGGQGAVYLGKERSTGTMRVVKFYEKAGGACLDDIKDEFELLKRMDHPNIARICEVFEDFSNIYVISEPYSGGDLCTVTEKAQKNGVQLTHQWLGLIFLQVIEGITYLHSKETMHCDLKEPNAMIADDKHWDAPQVVIIDFGMAKNFSGTRAGGTPGYMPPEFWQYQMWTPKGDIFALAVTFWSIYNCKQGGPFQVPDQPPYQRIQQATCAAPMDCSRFPPGLRQIVEKMATKDFRKRPTAKQVMQSPYFASLSDAEEREPLDQDMVNALVQAANRTDLQNMVALEMSGGQNLGQMKEMNTLFRQLDKDDDGTVEGPEAKEVLQQCGLPGDAASRLIDCLTGDDGKIKYSEFMARLISSQESMSSTKLASVFQEIDTDGSGTLSRSEIEQLMQKKAMASMLEGRSPESLVQEMDGNGDGVVSFEEFRRTMLGDSARPQSGFRQGDRVQYYSASNGKWVPCDVVAVDAKGRVQVSVKPGAWLNSQQQSSNLRAA